MQESGGVARLRIKTEKKILKVEKYRETIRVLAENEASGPGRHGPSSSKVKVSVALELE